VADSDPAAEHRECLNKLAALEAAIDLAEGA
jgi:anthranilate/para-aminobenzoate synthase component I